MSDAAATRHWFYALIFGGNIIVFIQGKVAMSCICIVYVCVSGCEGGDFAGSECEQLQGHVRAAVLWPRADEAQPRL